MERARVSLDVMRVDGRLFMGNHGLMIPVPKDAFGVIAELEILLEQALKEKHESKEQKEETGSKNC